jgi:hypothetical protein
VGWAATEHGVAPTCEDHPAGVIHWPTQPGPPVSFLFSTFFFMRSCVTAPWWGVVDHGNVLQGDDASP